MILTDPKQWVDLYEAIKDETRKSTEKHLQIYVSAADVDSVCALRALEVILQNDMVPHGWTAVSRYNEVIEDFLASYDEADEVIRYVVLINCGASEDMSILLNLSQRPNVCLVIIDYHRPIMHNANDNDPGSQVYILVDGDAEGLSMADIPPPEGDEDAQSDSEIDSDQENDEFNAPARQRRRLDGAPGSPEAISPRSARAARRRERKSREDARAAYYSQGSLTGKPSACVLYDLAYHLRQDTSNLLWLALVGLTDHFVHAKVDKDKYDSYFLVYENYVAQLGHLDEMQAPEVGVDGEGASVSVPTCRIVPQEDIRFGLLREWSLWDAMVYSPYVGARLQTYTEKGRQRLEFLLAKLGIPLKEARGSFQFDMQPQYRQRLMAQLADHGATYGLGDAIFKTYQLQDGYSRCIMAVDAVHAATALLESGTPRRVNNDHSQDGESTDRIWDHRDRFWRCWNALSWRDDDGELRRGIDLAKRVQRALVADGGAVIAQRLFHNFRAFRIFDLSEHKLGSQAMLARPLALKRLAAFFQEQHLHQAHTNRQKPVVLVGPKDSVTGRCLVVGYQVNAPGQGNRLGTAFAAAAEEVKAQAWHDLFDTAIMEIAGEDVERFKAELLRVATDLLW